MSGAGRDEFPQVAEEIPFDNDTNGFASDDVQEAIEESKAALNPGYSWGRPSDVESGVWLKNNDVVSNKTGLPFGYSNGFVKKVTAANSVSAASYRVNIYSHLGDLASQTLVGFVDVIAGSTVQTFATNFSINSNVMLGIQLTNVSSSPKPKDVQVFIGAIGD